MTDNPSSEKGSEIANFIGANRAESDEINWVTPTGIQRSREQLVGLLTAHNNLETEGSIRVADVGCGIGVLTKALAVEHPAAEITGIEYAPASYGLALERTTDIKNTTIIGGDATEILPKLPAFEFSYAINVVQDALRPIQLLEALADSLSSTGRLALTVPDEEATEIFSEYAHWDDTRDLPYMRMEDIEINGTKQTWTQYAFPDDRLREILHKIGLRVVSQQELSADARGLCYPMELIGDTEGRQRAEALVEQQQHNPDVGPSVPLYVVEHAQQ